MAGEIIGVKRKSDEKKSAAAIFAREFEHRQARDVEELDRLYKKYAEDEMRNRSSSEDPKGCGAAKFHPENELYHNSSNSASSLAPNISTAFLANSLPNKQIGDPSPMNQTVQPMIGVSSSSLLTNAASAGSHPFPHYLGQHANAFSLLYGSNQHLAAIGNGYPSLIYNPYYHQQVQQLSQVVAASSLPQIHHMPLISFNSTQNTSPNAPGYPSQEIKFSPPGYLPSHSYNFNMSYPINAHSNRAVSTADQLPADELPADVVQESDIDRIEPTRAPVPHQTWTSQ